jgi:hypothetical protein
MHAYSPFYSPYMMGFPAGLTVLLLVVIAYTLVLKGFALWYAARGGQKWWFVILLILNTLGIVEIVYLIWFRPNAHTHDQGKMPMNSSSSAQ